MVGIWANDFDLTGLQPRGACPTRSATTACWKLLKLLDIGNWFCHQAFLWHRSGAHVCTSSVCTRERYNIETAFQQPLLLQVYRIISVLVSLANLLMLFLEGRAKWETPDLPCAVPTADVSTKNLMASSEGRVLRIICPGPQVEYSAKPCSRANLLASFLRCFCGRCMDMQGKGPWTWSAFVLWIWSTHVAKVKQSWWHEIVNSYVGLVLQSPLHHAY